MKSTWMFALLATLGLAFGSQLLAQEAAPAEAAPESTVAAPAAEEAAPAVEEAAPVAEEAPAAPAVEEAAPAAEEASGVNTALRFGSF